MTDLRSVFDVIAKHSTTTEKLVTEDIAAARQAYTRLEISDIGLMRCTLHASIACPRSKNCTNLELLGQHVMSNHPDDEWVLHPDVLHYWGPKKYDCAATHALDVNEGTYLGQTYRRAQCETSPNDDGKDRRTQEPYAPENIDGGQTDTRGERDKHAESIMRTDNPSAKDD